MKLVIKDEHRPCVRSFQVVSKGAIERDDQILAWSICPALAAWIVNAANALNQIVTHPAAPIEVRALATVEFGEALTDREIVIELDELSTEPKGELYAIQ